MDIGSPNITWIPFYQEFANRLLEFRNNRYELISLIVDSYKAADLKIPKLDSTSTPTDIDPFTTFGLFNKGITDQNRRKIMAALAQTLNVTSPLPDGFDGVPVLNNLNATFYRFVGDPDRSQDDIDNLWQLFESALALADTKEGDAGFFEAFDQVRTIKGNRWKTTMGLYWIRPYSYINLDSRNRWFITEKSSLPESIVEAVRPLKNNVPSGSTYLSICNGIRECVDKGEYPFHDLPSLSYAAWILSDEVNIQNKAGKGMSVTDQGSTPDGRANSESDDVLVGPRGTHSWSFAPGHNASYWNFMRDQGVMAIGWGAIGDLSQYQSKTAIRDAIKERYDRKNSPSNDALATWQFANEIQVGDVIYAKRGNRTVIARGIVTSDYRFDPDSPIDYPNVRDVDWKLVGSWANPGTPFATKTLTDITSYTDDVQKLNELFDSIADDAGALDEDTPDIVYSYYTKDEFLNDVYMTEDDYDKLAFLVENKKNVILQGAPGVGKTFCAKRLAFSLLGSMDEQKVEVVQFHQSYSYEDFVEGYRPSGNGFELRKGPFYRFCRKAENDPDSEYFFIIDEINRGNLSKIFGELFMLIESDKRGVKLQLMYSDDSFFVPKNVRIIGMMNTADRGLALIDYALRRRFAFFDMAPGFDSDGFVAYEEGLNSEPFSALVKTTKALNDAIAADESLGEGFRIGHSYFCNLPAGGATPDRLSMIVEYELIPLLKEYWYDEPSAVDEWSAKLRNSIR